MPNIVDGESMTEQRQGAFLRVLWEPKESPCLKAVYRQAEECIRRGRKPPNELWCAVGEHNRAWLESKGVTVWKSADTPPDPPSVPWLSFLQAAVDAFGAAIWLGLDLLAVYSIRPSRFWPIMAKEAEFRVGLQREGQWQSEEAGPVAVYPKIVYSRSRESLVALARVAQANPTWPAFRILATPLSTTADSLEAIDLPIVRHAQAMRPPDPAIFQERKPVWQITPQLLPEEDDHCSVVIAARNQGQFLAEAIQSVVMQDAKPHVVYVDDGSTDDSIEIASRFDVTIIRQDHQAGVAAARNVGLKEVKSKYVLFLDGDDKLPLGYISAKLATKKTSGADFVYSPSKCFGDTNTLLAVPDWDVGRLWCRNYVNTSTLFCTADLLAIGGWHSTLEENSWDWSVALRLVAKGKVGQPERSRPLFYRRHAGGLSVNRSKEEQEAEGFLVRNSITPTAILSIYSGRLGARFFAKWLEAICDSVAAWRESLKAVAVKQSFVLEVPRPKLIVMATNGHRGLSGILDKYADSFVSVSLISERWGMACDSETERGRRVSVLLSDAYNRMVLGCGCQIVWTVEDDILVPSVAMTCLNRKLLETPRYAVSGAYRSRHTPEFILGSNWIGSKGNLTCEHYRDAKEDRWVTMAGTGCLMWSRYLAPHLFEPFCRGLSAHDWNWSERLANLPAVNSLRREVLLVSEVQCRHYQTRETWV